MFKQLYELIYGEISGDNAVNMTVDIWRHDRTVSYSEYAKSMRYCIGKMKDAGASEARIISFPATGEAKYGAYRLPRAWDGEDAELHIVSPEARRIASYRDNPWNLCNGSPGTDGWVEAPVVILNGGGNESDYQRVDVQGKIVFTNTTPMAIHKLAKKHGALGIISDVMVTNPVVRPAVTDLPDAVLWQRMDPQGELFAFMLSPRRGSELRSLIERTKEPVTVKAFVNACSYDGEHEMVSACIKGTNPKEEVALIAHMCEPGANDNASGAALCVEIMRTLQSLIDAGKLPRPYRSIRVWLVHEVQSLQALVHVHPEEMEKVVAAVNCDMVGEDQALCGSHLTCELGPDALPSFLNHVMIELIEYFKSRFYTWPNMGSNEAFYATMRTPFWLNDNFISDPSIGIPSVGLIQWPDKFYHTSEDTPEKLSPDSMARVGTLAATLAWAVANARGPEAIGFAEVVAARAGEFMREAAEKKVSEVIAMVEEADALADGMAKQCAEAWREADDYIDYVLNRQLVALESVTTLADTPNVRERIELARAEVMSEAAMWHVRLGRRLDDVFASHRIGVEGPAEEKKPSSAERKAAAIVPRRRLRGVVNMGELEISDDVRKAIEKAGKGGMPRLMLYWIDGERSLLDICRMTRHEGDGKPIEPARAIRWAEAMRDAGVLEF